MNYKDLKSYSHDLKTRIHIIDSLVAKLEDGSAEQADEVEDVLYLIFQNWSDLTQLEMKKFISEFRKIV